MRKMLSRIPRYYHSLRLLFIRGGAKRAAYLRKHNVLGAIGKKM